MSTDSLSKNKYIPKNLEKKWGVPYCQQGIKSLRLLDKCYNSEIYFQNKNGLKKLQDLVYDSFNEIVNLENQEFIDGINTYGKTSTDETGALFTSHDIAECLIKRGSDFIRFNLIIHQIPNEPKFFLKVLISGYKKFTNKVWNAARFIRKNQEGTKFDINLKNSSEFNDIDKWFLHLMNNKKIIIDELIFKKQFSEVAKTLYDVFINEFCRWYLEFVKVDNSLSGMDPIMKGNLYYIFWHLLSLVFPLIPYICQEIFENLYIHNQKNLNTNKYSSLSSDWIYPETFQNIELIKKIISLVRQVIGVNNLKDLKSYSIFISNKNKKKREILLKYLYYFKDLIKCRSIKVVPDINNTPKGYKGSLIGWELLIYQDSTIKEIA